jgi:hypothetical protein
MERLMITKNGVAYSATTAAGTANSLTLRKDLDLLKEGSIVAFEKNGTRVTAAGSFTKTDTKGQFALGMPAGVDTRLSPLINWSTLSYNKNIYKAATKQVSVLGADGVADKTTGAFAAGDVGTRYVVTTASGGSGDFRAGSTALLKDVSTGLAIAADTDLTLGQVVEVVAAGTPDAWDSAVLESNLAGTLSIGSKVVGASYGVDVIDLEKETWERRVYNVSLNLTSASMTDAQMLAAVVTAVNAHAKAKEIVLASVATGNVGIIFEGVTEGNRFAIKPTGLLYGSTVIQDGSGFSKVAVTGEGTNASVLKLEAETNSVEGKTGTAQGDELGDVWKVPSLVESGQNYTFYVLEWSDQREVAYPSNNANPNFKRLNIAVPSGDSTMITAMDNLLADLVA